MQFDHIFTRGVLQVNLRFQKVVVAVRFLLFLFVGFLQENQSYICFSHLVEQITELVVDVGPQFGHGVADLVQGCGQESHGLFVFLHVGEGHGIEIHD